MPPLKIESFTRVITATDDDASGFVYLGPNKGVYTLAAGIAMSPKVDRRKLRAVEWSVSHGGVLVPGATTYLFTLTGEQGIGFYQALKPCIQSAFEWGTWLGELPVEYGVGVLWPLGGVVVDDTLRLKVLYE